MLNRLKSLELNGYKTFAMKTLFEFAGNITVIVGPNGSGKSNIADAIRWVLGEQSYTLLRGRKTEDMIFSGSESRARSGMASATLTFDNSDGWLPIDFSEVAITRRAYRDGQNEYLINNQKVRLRDVMELLSNSGLAERTYTVIGQGLVDAALTLKSDERRRLFEEAAGIGLYRFRKEQALKRLDNTKRNLERVQDILSELSPRLHSLQRQAKRASEFEQVRIDLREVLREWYGYHWHQSQKAIREARDVSLLQDKTLQDAREKHAQVERSINELREKIAGLRGQLNSWHRQLAEIHAQREETSRDLAVTSERRRALQADQNRLDLEIARIEEELKLNQSRLDEAVSEENQRKNEVLEAEQELSRCQAALNEVKSERKALRNSIQNIQDTITGLQTKKIERTAERAALSTNVEKYEFESQALQKQLESELLDVKELEAQISEVEEQSKQAKEHIKTEEDSLQLQREKIDGLVAEKEDIQTKIAKISTDVARDKAELEVLIEAEVNLIGFTSGAKVLLEAIRGSQLDGLSKVLGSQIQVAPEYEIAIAAALGDYVEAVLIQPDRDVEHALQILEGKKAKAAILPLTQVSSLDIKPIPKIDGCIGIASELVQVPEEIKSAIDLLLGQVIVVKDRGTARKIVKRYESPIRVVTLRGEIFHPSGNILVDSEDRSSTIRRPRKRQEFEERINEAESNLKTLRDQFKEKEDQENAFREEVIAFEGALETAIAASAEVQSQIYEISSQLDKKRNQCDWLKEQKNSLDQEIRETRNRVNQVDTEIEKFQSGISQSEEKLHEESDKYNQLVIDDKFDQVSMWETQLAVAQRAFEHAEQSQSERKNDVERIQLHLQTERSKLYDVLSQISDLDEKVDVMRDSEGGIGGQINELQKLIEPAEAELTVLEQEQISVMNEEGKTRQALNVAERHSTQAQIALTRNQEALGTLRQRIEDDFGLVEFSYHDAVSGPTPLPFGEMVEQLPVINELPPDLEDTLKRQRLQLRRIGSVNPEAQQEYFEVKDRHEFLTTQLEDLQAAEKDIREVIVELDALMDRDFRKTFEVVAARFKENFSRLFDGGAAKLVLTDTENINDTGIDIEARLPGKRSQRLALLSGGERSLTAASLIFSLIEASPTPFCVMDEVDAMLDEVNVSRFRELLCELSKKTQFVVITHNRHTVQAADVIYGITMRRDTSSQSISLKLEEVDEKYSS
jgi:chromosome segregation protein